MSLSWLTNKKAGSALRKQLTEFLVNLSVHAFRPLKTTILRNFRISFYMGLSLAFQRSKVGDKFRILRNEELADLHRSPTYYG